MKTAGIICEYNPFHNGHAYHIKKTREEYGATHIVCVMSGNFTQRGDVALADKYERAKAALENGADLIIELPCAYALSSAEHFARAACYILNALSCVDILSFGSETGNIEALKEAAGAVHFATDSDEFFSLMRSGMSYPAALKQTVEKFYTPDVARILMSPNDTLAVEYIKALDILASGIEPVTVQRYGAAHDSDTEKSGTVSASKLRSMIASGEDVSAYTPYTDYENFAFLSNIETAILAKLRTMPLSELEKLPNITNGMENRIYKAVRASTSLAQLLLLIKSKNFTMARIRRIVLCAFLGITKNDLKIQPKYVRILGMNQRGKEMLSAAKDCPLPIDTSLSTLAKTDEQAAKQARLEERAGDLYALALNKKQPCGKEYTAKPVILP